MKSPYKVCVYNTYHVVLSNRKEPVFVCASCVLSAIKKVYNLIDQWEDKYKYSILSITYISNFIF